MKISKAKLRQIIKEEIGRLDRADEPRGGWPTSRGPRKRPLGDPAPGGEEDEDDRDLLAIQHYATEEQEAWRDSIEEDGAKPLSGSRVKRKSDGKIGYRTVGTKTGKRSEFWNIKWSGEPVEKNVPRDTFTIEKDK